MIVKFELVYTGNENPLWSCSSITSRFPDRSPPPTVPVIEPTLKSQTTPTTAYPTTQHTPHSSPSNPSQLPQAPSFPSCLHSAEPSSSHAYRHQYSPHPLTTHHTPHTSSSPSQRPSSQRGTQANVPPSASRPVCAAAFCCGCLGTSG